MMIETNQATLSIRRQCDLIGLNRSTFYWQPAGESPLNLALMRLIDQEYTRAPFYGYRKMTTRLRTRYGYRVNHKRIARLMHKMGLQAVFPRPRTSLPDASRSPLIWRKPSTGPMPPLSPLAHRPGAVTDTPT